MVAREPTASRAAAELNFIVDVWNIKRNDHLDVGEYCSATLRGMEADAFAFEVPSAEEGEKLKNERC